MGKKSNSIQTPVKSARPALSEYNSARLKIKAAKEKTNVKNLLDSILNIFFESDISINEFKVIKDKNFMQKYHHYTAGFLTNFEKNQLSLIEKQNAFMGKIFQLNQEVLRNSQFLIAELKDDIEYSKKAEEIIKTNFENLGMNDNES